MKKNTAFVLTLSVLFALALISQTTFASGTGTGPKCGASEDVQASKEIRGGGKGFGHDRSEFAKSEPQMVGGENTRSALDFNRSPDCGGPADPPPSDVFPPLSSGINDEEGEDSDDGGPSEDEDESEE